MSSCPIAASNPHGHIAAAEVFGPRLMPGGPANNRHSKLRGIPPEWREYLGRQISACRFEPPGTRAIAESCQMIPSPIKFSRRLLVGTLIAFELAFELTASVFRLGLICLDEGRSGLRRVFGPKSQNYIAIRRSKINQDMELLRRLWN